MHSSATVLLAVVSSYSAGPVDQMRQGLSAVPPAVKAEASAPAGRTSIGAVRESTAKSLAQAIEDLTNLSSDLRRRESSPEIIATSGPCDPGLNTTT